MKKDYIFLILFFILVLCFLFILISFYLFKYLQIKVLDKWYLNDYSRNNKKLLSKFGDWDIKYIYLVKEPISKFSYILMNIITLNSFSNAI